jgi:hypothetical protein
MTDIFCPYCDCEIDICNNDGFGLDENKTWQQQCLQCKKYFVFHSTLWWSYSPEKADCLNGSPHQMEPYPHYPTYYPDWKLCRVCGAEEKGPRRATP